MNIVDLWINDELIDLYAETKIRHTFQVNDIAEVKDRQASRTNMFAAPKTAKNVRTFRGLSISSDTSTIPYEKPNCRMKLEGFDLIVKGWAHIKESSDDFKIYVYSGIINFFKAIENKTLGNDLDLSEIDHSKNLQTVINSFSNQNYRYFIADFNGKTHYGPNDSIINIDYLIPGARVKYLWKKLHDTFGFDYLGEIFSDPEFDNLFISYPKGFANDNLVEKFNQNFTKYFDSAPLWYGNEHRFFMMDIPVVTDHAYKLLMDFNIWHNSIAVPLPATFRMYIDIHKTNGNIESYTLGYNQGGTGTYVKFINLEQGDFIRVWGAYAPQSFAEFTVSATVKLFEFTQSSISFSEELKDFGITDFVKEILNRFGLTMFPNEFSNEMKYKTLHERINTSKKIDWSSKMIRRKDENYVYDSYAQQNNFQFNYNDKEANYHDSSILISNKNIADSKTVFKSKTYAPEKLKTLFNLNATQSFESDVFKVHDKEVKEENGTNVVKYKPLSKRYFFIVGVSDTSTIELGSEVLNETQTVSSFFRGKFASNWGRLLRKYYPEFSKIMNDSRIHEFDLDMDDTDVLQLEFDALYYFYQEQQWYFLNKLIADDKRQSGEFVRVKPFETAAIIIDPVDPTTDITLIEWNDGTGTADKSGSATSVDVKLTSIQSSLVPNILSKDWQIWDGNNYVSAGTDVSPFTMNTPIIGANRIRMRIKLINGTSVYSNVLTYNRANYLPCKAYRASKIGGSGDDLTVWYRDCNYVEQTYTIYANAPNTQLTLEFCASEGTFMSNGTDTDLGPC